MQDEAGIAGIEASIQTGRTMDEIARGRDKQFAEIRSTIRTSSWPS